MGLRRLLVSSSIGPIASLILLEILTPIYLTVNTLLIFNVALAETDIKKIMNDGLAQPLGVEAIEPKDKLTAIWARIKF